MLSFCLVGLSVSSFSSVGFFLSYSLLIFHFLRYYEFSLGYLEAIVGEQSRWLYEEFPFASMTIALEFARGATFIPSLVLFLFTLPSFVIFLAFSSSIIPLCFCSVDVVLQ